MSQRQPFPSFFWFATYSIFLVCMGVLMGWGLARTSWEVEAVERNHAEFYFDDNHVKQWRWLIVPDATDGDATP